MNKKNNHEIKKFNSVQKNEKNAQTRKMWPLQKIHFFTAKNTRKKVDTDYYE